MTKWLKELLIAILTDDRFKQVVKDLLGTLITERLLPLVPVAAAAAAKAAVDQIVEKVPALEGVVDAAKVADDARDTLNELIPDNYLGIPMVDDLIDFWRPKK